MSLHQQSSAEPGSAEGCYEGGAARQEEMQGTLIELKEQLVQQQEDSSLQKVLQETQAAALQEEAVDALGGE